MKPILTQILVKPYPSDEISEGGIFVPESARRISNKVKIVAVGNGSKNRPMKLNPGETAFRVKDWGCGIFIEGELHFIMDEKAIIAAE